MMSREEMEAPFHDAIRRAVAACGPEPARTNAFDPVVHEARRAWRLNAGRQYCVAMHELLDLAADADYSYIRGMMVECYGVRDRGQDPEEYAPRLPTHDELAKEMDDYGMEYCCSTLRRMGRAIESAQ